MGPDSPNPVLRGRRVVLGVTGSIAAYKAVSLLRALTRAGASVSVVMTQAATRFVTPLTFEVLSGGRVTLDLFETHEEMRHLSVPSGADVIVVAPATANCLAKAAVGLADDVLSTMLLAARCPLVLAPAMDGDMWRHPTVVAHTAALRERGALVLDPEVGPLASGHVGQGRLADETRVLKAIETALIPVSDWRGQCVLISAGPTQEAIDPVRFISNRSSGKMGYAVAEAARDRGAEIVLVSGPTALDPPRGITLVRVTTADEMANALRDHFSWATVVIMAAAVADYRPKEPASQKIKKRTRTEWSLELETSTDILAMLSARRTTQILVGFAAETEHLITRAAEKLAAKGLDLIVANNVARPEAGFGSDQNAAVILARDGRQEEFGLMPKRLLADKILTSILEFRRAQQTNRASLTSE